MVPALHDRQAARAAARVGTLITMVRARPEDIKLGMVLVRAATGARALHTHLKGKGKGLVLDRVKGKGKGSISTKGSRSGCRMTRWGT
jgi:hypothetical protein